MLSHLRCARDGRDSGSLLCVYFELFRGKGVLRGKAEEGCKIRRGLVRGAKRDSARSLWKE